MELLVAVNRATILRLQAEIVGCETCSGEAEIPLSWALDEVTGRDGATTDYVLGEPVVCPRCRSPILEETLIEWE